MSQVKGIRIFLFILLVPCMLWAQAPVINYNPPPVFTINTGISRLSPINTGGTVPAAQYGIVTTVAGGTAGYSEGTGAAATFYKPVDITYDRASGNLYVADLGNYVVRKITPAGVVSTLAGHLGGHADGLGPAAQFNTPFSIGTDASGNVFVGENPNQLIRDIDPAGNVTTYSGTYNTVGNANGPRATATYDTPTGMVFDANGNLFVSDYDGGLIRKIDKLTGIVTTIAGNSTRATIDGFGTAASFKTPRGMAFDKLKNFLYVVDISGNAIRKINMATLQVTTVITGIDAYDITLDNTGNIFMCAGPENAIKELSASGVISVVAGNLGVASGDIDGIRETARFSNPLAITSDDAGNLYVVDYGNNAIREVGITGYTIDKPLPAGLIFDYETGFITGTPTVTLPPTQYVITGHNADGSDETTITLEIDGPPIINFPAIPGKDICDADFDPGATSTNAIVYSSSDVAVATIVANKVHIVGAGTSTITATSNGVAQSQTVTVTGLPVSPSVTIAADATNHNCIGSFLSFKATPTSGGAHPSYQWKVNGVDQNVDSPTFLSGTLNNNDKVTCVLSNNDYCKPLSAVSNPITVLVGLPTDNLVTINATATSVYAATPVTFTAETSSPATVTSYQWSVNNIAVGISTVNFTSSTLADGDVVTCKVVSGGCTIDSVTVSNSVTVTIKPVVTITVPNTFTPNGDGINDLWNIDELVAFPNCTVDVFNRYGTPVFHSVGYSKSWTGATNNKALPTGTYYYIIDAKDEHQKVIKGWVSILR
jgi:gliding motility-associated-like protein